VRNYTGISDLIDEKACKILHRFSRIELFLIGEELHPMKIKLLKFHPT